LLLCGWLALVGPCQRITGRSPQETQGPCCGDGHDGTAARTAGAVGWLVLVGLRAVGRLPPSPQASSCVAAALRASLVHAFLGQPRRPCCRSGEEPCREHAFQAMTSGNLISSPRAPARQAALVRRCALNRTRHRSAATPGGGSVPGRSSRRSSPAGASAAQQAPTLVRCPGFGKDIRANRNAAPLGFLRSGTDQALSSPARWRCPVARGAWRRQFVGLGVAAFTSRADVLLRQGQPRRWSPSRTVDAPFQ